MLIAPQICDDVKHRNYWTQIITKMKPPLNKKANTKWRRLNSFTLFESSDFCATFGNVRCLFAGSFVHDDWRVIVNRRDFFCWRKYWLWSVSFLQHLTIVTSAQENVSPTIDLVHQRWSLMLVYQHASQAEYCSFRGLPSPGVLDKLWSMPRCRRHSRAP